MSAIDLDDCADCGNDMTNGECAWCIAHADEERTMEESSDGVATRFARFAKRSDSWIEIRLGPKLRDQDTLAMTVSEALEVRKQLNALLRFPRLPKGWER
jgi:hypothetical protein